MNIEPICFVFMFINVIARKIFPKSRLRLIMYYELMRIMYSKVWLDGDSLCAWSFVITSLSYKENFSFLYRMVLFLSSLGLFFSFSFSFFLPRTFFRSWFFREQRFFHKQRTSTSEFFCRLPRHFLRGFTQVRDYDTFLIYYLSFENTFF